MWLDFCIAPWIWIRRAPCFFYGFKGFLSFFLVPATYSFLLIAICFFVCAFVCCFCFFLLSYFSSHSPFFSAPLHPISASNPLTLKSSLHPWCDPQFCAVPKAIHLSGEVFGELGWVDQQQGFVVGVGSRRRPVEAPSDHFFVVDHSELVMHLVPGGKPWDSNAMQCNFKWRIIFFKFAVSIW